MKRFIWLLLAPVFASGCLFWTGYPGGIEPVHPSPSMWAIKSAASIRPTFTWRDKKATRLVTYDLGIWEYVEVGDTIARGERIYFKQGIAGTSFTIDVDLEPDTKYYWSVRRSTVQEWASESTSFVVAAPGGSASGTINQFFFFWTPAQ